MRWCQRFQAEVSQSIQQLGLKACPVCGLADSLGVGHLPVLLNDGGFPPRAHDDSRGEDCDADADLTLAVRIECAACGYLMLFNALRFRNADEKIIVPEETDEGQLGQ